MARGIFLDIESNGLDCYRHRVMQVALQVVSLETGSRLASYESNLFLSPQEWEQSDPQSLMIHGLCDYAACACSPSREQVGGAITQLLLDQGVDRSNSLFICQNPSFDRPFFAQLVSPQVQEQYRWPYHWLDLASMFWARHMAQEGLPTMEMLSKDAIATALGISPEEKPHRAMAGVKHLVRCYEVLVGWHLAAAATA